MAPFSWLMETQPTLIPLLLTRNKLPFMEFLIRMRQYLCECMTCGWQRNMRFDEPYPKMGDVFPRHCDYCEEDTIFTRTMTKKAQAEMNRIAEENALQESINYGGRIAVYGDYSHYTSKPLHDFIYESNKGKDVFFVGTKEEAIGRLTQ